MRGVLVLLSTLLSGFPGSMLNSHNSHAIVRASAAVAPISRHPSGARLISLPTLEFPLTIDPRCEAGKRLESVSVSIADTHRVYAAAEFAAAAMTLASTIRLPEPQIGPLAIGTFCTNDEMDADRHPSLLIEDAFTASVALRCSDDAGATLKFEALPMDVLLLCEPAVENASDGADSGRDDQESSASPPRF